MDPKTASDLITFATGFLFGVMSVSLFLLFRRWPKDGGTTFDVTIPAAILGFLEEYRMRHELPDYGHVMTHAFSTLKWADDEEKLGRRVMSLDEEDVAELFGASEEPVIVTRKPALKLVFSRKEEHPPEKQSE